LLSRLWRTPAMIKKLTKKLKIVSVDRYDKFGWANANPKLIGDRHVQIKQYFNNSEVLNERGSGDIRVLGRDSLVRPARLKRSIKYQEPAK